VVILPKFEQLLHFMPLFRLHFFKDGLGTLVGEFGQQIGRRPWIHLFHDVRYAAGVERFQQRLLQARVYFL
jgi:hypothetical protein